MTFDEIAGGQLVYIKFGVRRAHPSAAAAPGTPPVVALVTGHRTPHSDRSL
ncbi:MAG: hypothetical protein JWM21_2660 [Acidobacteria bacterium]|nr:hypothetical protein [Acidobacteriota bacterium]